MRDGLVVPMMLMLSVAVWPGLATTPPSTLMMLGPPPIFAVTGCSSAEAQSAAASENMRVARMPASEQCEACPRLDGILCRLVHAVDIETFAQEQGLELSDGRVRVEVLLTADHIVLDLDVFDVVVIATYRNLRDLLVPPGQLCRLAQAEGVLRVDAPLRATPTVPGVDP